jgi:hypothetical protein
MDAAKEKFGAAGRGLNLADRVSKVALLLREETPAGIHSRLLSNPVAPEQLLAAGRGARRWHNTLWPVLMFQAWQQEQRIAALSPRGAASAPAITAPAA